MVGLRGVPSSYSGIERMVEELGKRLVEADHEVTIFCMRGRYKERPPAYGGMTLRYLPSLPGKHLEMLSHAAISTLAATFGTFDIVHFHACGPSLFAGVPRLLGKLTVVTLHGPDWKHTKWNRVASAVLRLGEWSACRLANRTISVSMAQRRNLKLRLGAEVDYIANAVPQLQYRPSNDAKAEYGLSSQNYIIFVGRLTSIKNVHHLVEAFRGLETDKKLVLVGGHSSDAAYADHIRMLAEADPRIIFTGEIFEKEILATLYSNAYLFCLPSASEGQSVALLEAMSYGTPVLVSDIDANLEVITGKEGICGLTFPVGSAEKLRVRLHDALGMADNRRSAATGTSARR